MVAPFPGAVGIVVIGNHPIFLENRRHGDHKAAVHEAAYLPKRLGGMRGSAVDRVARLADGFHFVGTPEEIVAMLKQRLGEVPITGTIMRVPPGMEHQKGLRCMELVAREVMPHFVD
jgi:alkanesulfonate monooxygenase SsuD/methylene tetrahydromethanopterin reductase-like flavin-dependent oxidoreductase (luciferase family)